MIIPFSKQAPPQRQGPDVSPTYIAMAAAMMHQEGRFVQAQEQKAKQDGKGNPSSS